MRGKIAVCATRGYGHSARITRDTYRDNRDIQAGFAMTRATDAPKTTTPAGRLIARFGPKRLAAWTKRHPSRVHAWAWSIAKGGTGGAIPARLRPAIIAGARDELGEVVTWADFEPAEGETFLYDAKAASPC
jgi:hypothetical protein